MTVSVALLLLFLADGNLLIARPAAGEGVSPLPRESLPTQPPSVAKEDVLAIRDGQLFLDGKPFAEISFNKFDLFWQLYDQLAAGKPLEATNPMVEAQDRALRQLHELGFRTIRFFALPWGPEGPAAYVDPEKRKMLYAALDKTVELCDAHNIRVVWSLGAGAFTDTRLDPARGWIHGEEQLRELVANRESRSRNLLYRYIDETVARYRNRKAVLMWEISNEMTLQADIGDQDRVYNGERMPTLKELAVFFNDVARRIKAADPLRLVSSGGSNMRESQWHLYLRQGWKRDTFEDQFKCFELLYANSAVDVIDIHSYPNGQPGYRIADAQGKEIWIDNMGYMDIARGLHKPLMIGELGLQPAPKTDRKTWSTSPDYFETYDDQVAAKPWVLKTLNAVIEARVPLTYWWCYQSDRVVDRNNRQHFDIDCERNPELVACIVQANKRLQAALNPPAQTNPPRFRVIAFYSGQHDKAHISFVEEANRWFPRMAAEHSFAFDATTNWASLNPEFLAKYQVVVFLDSRPEAPAQREAFQEYVQKGGGWIGFHFAGFALTPSELPQNWDWYHNEFLGTGSYAGNTWRPTPAILKIEDRQFPVTKGLPEVFKSSPNEWYKWTSDLRTNRDIKILVSIDPASFPLGTGPKPHEVWHSGYYPVVWTNQKYRMVYFNDRCYRNRNSTSWLT